MRLISITLLLLINLKGFTQLTIYHSYSNFENDNGVKYDSMLYRGAYHVSGEIGLRFKNPNKEKLKVDCSSIWGFRYKGKLFRCFQSSGQPVRLMSKGKICYYENGDAHMKMLDSGRERAYFSDFSGTYCYFSKDLTSEIVPVQLMGKIWKFRERHPEYKSLFDCIKRHVKETKIRPCVKEFEEF